MHQRLGLPRSRIVALTMRGKLKRKDGVKSIKIGLHLF